jgi:diadenosine tetraphosphatase ApaH/serine/threonine PP2A family protein phosphatase
MNTHGADRGEVGLSRRDLHVFEGGKKFRDRIGQLYLPVLDEQHQSSEQLEWLRALPPALRLADGVFACHGRAGDDNAYMLENVVGGRLALASRQEIAERIGTIDARVVFCAHSHIPRVVTAGGKVIVNPGSIGLPAYEDPAPPAHVSETGSPHARYAIVTLLSDRVEVEMIAIPYDHPGAAKRAEENGSTAWAHFLATGFARTRIEP